MISFVKVVFHLMYFFKYIISLKNFLLHALILSLLSYDFYTNVNCTFIDWLGVLNTH